jgi:hypothetical protein
MRTASPAVQAWSAMLADEVRTWPGVTERSMFGLIAFYRAKKMFAALPKSKTIGLNSFIFKLQPVTPAHKAKLEADRRIDTSDPVRWIAFELEEEADLHAALAWLQVAYEHAPTIPAPKKHR